MIFTGTNRQYGAKLILLGLVLVDVGLCLSDRGPYPGPSLTVNATSPLLLCDMRAMGPFPTRSGYLWGHVEKLMWYDTDYWLV